VTDLDASRSPEDGRAVHPAFARPAHIPDVRITRVIGVLEPGGAQLSLLRLAQAQTALGVQTRLLAGDATAQGVALARRFGLDPDVLALHDQIDHSVRQWAPDPLFARWLAAKLEPADLVHAHMFGAWWAATVAAPPGMPLVASEHNELTWPLGDHRAVAAAAAPHVDRFYFHGPDHHAYADLLGVDRSLVLPGRSAIAVNPVPRPGLASPRITFTGRLREDKGPDLLVRAVALLPDPPMTYVVGDGPMHRELRRLTESLGIRRGVHFAGWSNEPSRYVAGSTVHVVPSREEAWSQSAVTALALGVPVVGTDVEGLPTTLAGRRGLVVAPEPAAIAAGIQSVLDGTAAVDLEAGRRYAAAFRPAEVASWYFAGYQQVLAGRQTSPQEVG
jgi:glycosyltransferase involved in cell wall biosynthesis